MNLKLSLNNGKTKAKNKNKLRGRFSCASRKKWVNEFEQIPVKIDDDIIENVNELKQAWILDNIKERK